MLQAVHHSMRKYKTDFPYLSLVSNTETEVNQVEGPVPRNVGPLEGGGGCILTKNTGMVSKTRIYLENPCLMVE